MMQIFSGTLMVMFEMFLILFMTESNKARLTGVQHLVRYQQQHRQNIWLVSLFRASDYVVSHSLVQAYGKAKSTYHQETL